MNKTENGHGVLSDHKKQGKILIPPFVQAIPNMTEVSYRKQTLPDLLWIAILIHKLGEVIGTAAALNVARAAAKIRPDRIMGFCSNFRDLTDVEKKKVTENIIDLEPISLALSSFISLYPECPLRFVCLQEHLDKISGKAAASSLRKLLPTLFDPSSRESTMMQAGLLYIAFCTDKFKVQKGLTLEDFPAVEDYPKTELSKKIAASIRSTMNLMSSMTSDHSWQKYFWNRNYEIDHCKIHISRNE